MKRPARILFGTLAAIGGAFVAFSLYAAFFLSGCLYVPGATALSPNGRYVATFSQTQCEDASLNKGEVRLGVVRETNEFVVYAIQGTSDVDLTWNGDAELQVLLPKSAVFKRYDLDGSLPHVTEIKRR